MLNRIISLHFQPIDSKSAENLINSSQTDWVIHNADMGLPFVAVTYKRDGIIRKEIIYAGAELGQMYRSLDISSYGELHPVNFLIHQLNSLHIQKTNEYIPSPLAPSEISITDNTYSIILECKLTDEVQELLQKNVFSPEDKEEKMFPVDPGLGLHITLLIIGQNSWMDHISQTTNDFNPLLKGIQELCNDHLTSHTLTISNFAIFGRDSNTLALMMDPKNKDVIAINELQKSIEGFLASDPVNANFKSNSNFILHITVARKPGISTKPISSPLVNELDDTLKGLKPGQRSVYLTKCFLTCRSKQMGTEDTIIGTIEFKPPTLEPKKPSLLDLIKSRKNIKNISIFVPKIGAPSSSQSEVKSNETKENLSGSGLTSGVKKVDSATPSTGSATSPITNDDTKTPTEVSVLSQSVFPSKAPNSPKVQEKDKKKSKDRITRSTPARPKKDF